MSERQVPTLPLAQAQLQSQKTMQNNGSTSTSCLYKTVLARDSGKACAPMFSQTVPKSTVHCTSSIPHVSTVLICCSGHQVLWNRSPFEPHLILINWTCLPFGVGFGAGFTTTLGMGLGFLFCGTKQSATISYMN